MLRIKKNVNFIRRVLIKVGCFYCGWKQTACDVHHIDGNRSHWSLKNLTYACPNCHRMIHRGLINEFVTIDQFVKDKPDLVKSLCPDVCKLCGRSIRVDNKTGICTKCQKYGGMLNIKYHLDR